MGTVDFTPPTRTIATQPQVGFVHVAKQHELLHDERRGHSHHELGAVGAERALGGPTFVLESHLEVALAAVGDVPTDVQGRQRERSKTSHPTASHQSTVTDTVQVDDFA